LLRQSSFAALTHRGSRWPPGSLLILAVVMPKHEVAIQIARRLNELAMVGVFFIVLAPLMHSFSHHHQGLPSRRDIMISTLLPLASIALKLGSQLLGSSSKPQPTAQQTVQEERLPPTVQSLFQRLGVKDANSEQNRAAINHFMGELMQTLGQENSGQSLPAAIDSARNQLASGTQSTRLDALQSELDTLKGTLGASDLNLDQLLGAFKQTLPNGKAEGVGKLLNASA
jgi:hypothetical protein